MFTFFLKKNFCDGWDNFFFLVFSNFVTIFLLVLSFFAVRYSALVSPLLPYLAIILASGLVSVTLFAWGANAAKLADFCSGSFGLFFSALKTVWKIGFAFGAMVSGAILIVRFAISYYISLYLSNGSYLGLVMTALLGWFILISAIAFQWFIPLYFLQGNNGFKKCLKKSFIIFYDNISFSVAVFIYNLVLFVLSCVFFMLVPGLNGILLSSTNALRLRLYKYDWIEKKLVDAPDFESDREKRSNVPWEELIAEDRESLGPRNIKSFIFPWK